MTRFADPQLAALTVLRAAAPGVTFGTKAVDDYPEGAAPGLPYVQVRAGAAAVRWPVAAVTPLRIVAWADTEAAATALAWQLHGVLLDYRHGRDIKSFAPELGPFPAADPDTGRPLCSFSVLARLRPQQ
ncbi:hypothetical protein [Actinoplanes philippinensis]|uniref:hypothetical protein n=1 Tax=Actinoplanes philippinensis TaxID=35752 RepID=UPI0033E72C34